MDVNVIVCPNCGAKIRIEPNKEYAICEYCDSQVLIDDGHEKVEYIDQARIKEAELESKRIDELRWEKERELEELHRWQRIRNAWFIAIVALFCVMIFFDSYEQASTIASRILACLLLAGFIVWGIKPKASSTSGPQKPEVKKEPPKAQDWQADKRKDRNPYDKSYEHRDSRFDPIDSYDPYSDMSRKKLPWYIRTGWIIVIGLFTDGLYWIIGPIIRIWWRKKH